MLRLLIVACLSAVSFGASIPENSEIEGYIVGGNDTDISEVPYQVVMYKNGQFMCGGSIVAPTMIVTAAHCAQRQTPSSITFRAGSSKTSRDGVVVKAKNIWVHSYYNSRTMDYDVAVVELEQPLSYSNTIKPIKLATVEPSEGSSVKVSGWGLLREDGPLPKILQSVVVPVISRKVCTSNYSKYLTITPRMICAGLEGKDSCQGDSGGPLNGKGELVGVVSFGIGCARKNLPGVYTNVANPDINAFIRKYAKI